MKVVILAGGLGTRLSEETSLRPKPMVEIGGRPILWHIMKMYEFFGFNEFIILLGYKGAFIKEYFYNYFLHNSDLTVDLSQNKAVFHNNCNESWSVTMLDTGLATMTGSRILRARKHIDGCRFLLTYGDGVADVDISAAIKAHDAANRILTMTCVQPTGRFGSLNISREEKVSSFVEKPRGDGGWINGGFFVCEPDVFEYIGAGDSVIFEDEPLANLVADGQVTAYRHFGFWRPMDSLKDKNDLNSIWDGGEPPWKVW